MVVEKILDKIKKKIMFILPSVFTWRSAKFIFAECPGVDTQQRLTLLTIVRSCRAFAECHSLPSVRHSAKQSLPSVLFCRVPDTR
jgi:hypothetical protein